MKKYLNKLLLYILFGGYIILNFSNQKIEVKSSNLNLLSNKSDDVILSFKVMEIKDFKYPFNEYIFYKDNMYSIVTYNDSVTPIEELITGNEITIQYNANELIEILKKIELKENTIDLKIRCENCNIWKENILEKEVFIGGNLKYQKNLVNVYVNNKKISNENKIFEIILNYPIKGELLNRKKNFLLINDPKLYQDKNIKEIIEFFNSKMFE